MFPTLLYRSPQPRVSAKMRCMNGMCQRISEKSKDAGITEGWLTVDTGPEPDVSKQGNTAGLKPRKEGTRLEWRAHASTHQNPPAPTTRQHPPAPTSTAPDTHSWLAGPGFREHFRPQLRGQLFCAGRHWSLPPDLTFSPWCSLSAFLMSLS